VTVTAAELEAALEALGMFGDRWRRICRDEIGAPRKVDDARRELADFAANAERWSMRVSRACGPEATGAALDCIRGYKIAAARARWMPDVPYLHPTTASAWRIAEVFRLRHERAPR
jgi:hypothetical protein